MCFRSRTCLASSSLWNIAVLCESRIPFFIVSRLVVIRLCLPKFSFCLCNLCFSLADSSLCIYLGLVYSDVALFKLRLENSNLLLGASEPCLGLLHFRLFLFLARVDLFVVYHSDELANLDVVTFTHGDFTNTSGDLRRDRCIIAFDSATELDQVFGSHWFANQAVPN